jgi:hypothetical protein
MLDQDKMVCIDKSTAFQTICQTKKYYQTRVGGIYSYKGDRGYISYRDRGYRGISIYRPNSPSQILRRSMSHILRQGVGGEGI